LLLSNARQFSFICYFISGRCSSTLWELACIQKRLRILLAVGLIKKATVGE
jgi:hypothetical protein